MTAQQGEQVHILVVDDDQAIRAMLRRYLVAEGFQVSEAGDGIGMRASLERESNGREPIGLVLLDLMMPGEDGLSLARHVRSRSNVPIIMLTGKDDLIDRVAGLEAGADDYIPKPFHLREVLARIRTVLRRSQPNPGSSFGGTTLAVTPPPAATGEALLFEGWRLDISRRSLTDPKGTPVMLTSGEFDLLRALAMHPNRVLSRDQLLDLVKGREWAASDRTIDTQIVRLRRKIEADPAEPQLIKTVRGAGYLFAAGVTATGV